MPVTMTWKPIFERARVSPVLADIAAALDAHPRDHYSEFADYAVVRSYLASDETIPDHEDRASGAMVAAIDRYAARGGGANLYGGAARIGWTVAHHSDGGDAEAVCEVIDASLVAHLNAGTGWTRDYDLVGGLAGFGVYALERGAAGAAIMRAVVTGLEAYMARGWVTPPALLPELQRADAPDGYVNFGLAHGLPGVIAVLARFCELGFERDRSLVVLDSALRRLLDGNPRRARGRFVAWQPTSRSPTTRLAWCYGDLGVATALLGAGIALDHDEARSEGLALALDCAARSYHDAHITDAGICHGAAGIAHLFNRMAQATGATELRDAAVRWIEATLAIRRDEPLAGFPANRPDDSGSAKLVPDASLLTGAGGVALVLHAACSDVEPGWDRLLLADLPPRP